MILFFFLENVVYISLLVPVTSMSQQPRYVHLTFDWRLTWDFGRASRIQEPPVIRNRAPGCIRFRAGYEGIWCLRSLLHVPEVGMN